MKTVEIKANAFFDLLKLHDVSMWEIFAQMIDGEEKTLVFIDDGNQVLFSYVLPKDQEKLKKDQEVFAKEYAQKLADAVNQN